MGINERQEMELKAIEIPATNQCRKEIDWLNNRFIPAQELFPHWITAPIMLDDFASRTKGWIFDRKSDFQLGLEFPLINDAITGELVPMFLIFPPEERDKVCEICMNLMRDYLPNLDHFLGLNLTDRSIHNIKHEIMSWESEIIHQGGNSVLTELRFRLGLYSWMHRDA